MELKHQVSIGVSLTLGSLILLYLFRQRSSGQKKHEIDRARKLVSKYKPRPSAEDIIADNEFQGRVVCEKVSESGIVYHDIRYKDTHNGASAVDAFSDVDRCEAPSVKQEVYLPVTALPNAKLFSHATESTIPPLHTSETDDQLTNKIPAEQLNGHISDSSEKENIVVKNTDIQQSVISNGISGGNPSREDLVKSVVAAKDKFEEDRRNEIANQEIIQQCFNIPSRAVGKIIGKEGKSIKGICRQTGCKLNFPTKRDRDLPTQKLFVTGTLRQVTEAVSLLVSLMPADSICHELISWTPEIAVSGDLHPIELIENTVCIGRVTHITSPDNLWIQMCRGPTGTDYSTMLANLSDNITETLGRKMYDLRTALVPAANLKQGLSCAVMLENRAWRATVLNPGVPENNIHQVRLVDFGTPHSFTELYQLSSYYLTMPALAVQCSLAHISKLEDDPVWPSEASEYLEETLRDCFVKVKTVEEGNIPVVELYTQPGNDQEAVYINRELVLDGYAKWQEKI